MKIKVLLFLSIFCIFTAEAQIKNNPAVGVDLKYDAINKYIHMTIVNNEQDTVHISCSPLNGSVININFLKKDQADGITGDASNFGLGTHYQQRLIKLAPKEVYKYTYEFGKYTEYEYSKSSFNRIRFNYNIRYFIFHYGKGTYEMKFLKGEKFFKR